jgi:hypothetical protein
MVVLKIRIKDGIKPGLLLEQPERIVEYNLG